MSKPNKAYPQISQCYLWNTLDPYLQSKIFKYKARAEHNQNLKQVLSEMIQMFYLSELFYLVRHTLRQLKTRTLVPYIGKIKRLTVIFDIELCQKITLSEVIYSVYQRQQETYHLCRDAMICHWKSLQDLNIKGLIRCYPIDHDFYLSEGSDLYPFDRCNSKDISHYKSLHCGYLGTYFKGSQYQHLNLLVPYHTYIYHMRRFKSSLESIKGRRWIYRTYHIRYKNPLTRKEEVQYFQRVINRDVKSVTVGSQSYLSFKCDC